MAIPREVIPAEFTGDGAAFIDRLIINIDNELEKRSILPKFKVLPKRPVQAKQYYFIHAILPDITEEGIWIYKGGIWVLVA